MRVGNGRAGATRAGLVGLGFTVCAWGLIAAALGQGIGQGKKAAPGPGPPQVKKSAPTFTKDVASILQAKCQNCHRRHQVGPFALETYEQARKRSRRHRRGDRGAVDAALEADAEAWAPSSNTTSR